MLLAVDIGNTQTAFGLYRAETLAHHFRVATDRQRTADEYGALLTQLLRGVGVQATEIEAAVLASVVPPVTATFKSMLSTLGVKPLAVEPGIKTGMPIHYESPRDVGADRIVNAVAGYERLRRETGGPYGLIIVDFGTATTFDVVSPRGEYLGGAIAPGLGISTEALFTHASKLPRVDLVVPPSPIGRSTVTSMQSGIIWGTVALVDGMVARMREEVDFVPRVIATGMMAELIAPHSRAIEITDDLLTLQGLRIIHARNAQGK